MTEPLDFHVDTSRVAGAFVVAPRGDVDLASASALQAALEAREPDDRAVVLDLRGVDFLDTSGLRVVVEETHRAEAGGYRFAIVRGPARVQRIFDIAGVAADGMFVNDPAEAGEER